MKTNDNYRYSELPYNKLALIGLDRKAADLLPENIKKMLVAGEVTPFIEASINVNGTQNGNTLKLPVKLQMVSDHNGKDVLLVYPAYRELDLTKNNPFAITPAEAESLLKGEVLKKEVEINGERNHRYLQLDPETNNIMSKKVNDVKLDQKLMDMEKINDIQLGLQQKQQAREGRPIELNVGGEKVSVGVDLKEPQGFKVMQGDMSEWDRQKKMKYDDVHPEYIGLVMTDKNRWEYQQVVKQDEMHRAVKFPAQQQRSDRKSSMSL